MNNNNNKLTYLNGLTVPSLSSVFVDSDDHFLRLALLALCDGDVLAGGVVLRWGAL